MNTHEQAVLDLAGPVPATFNTFHAGPNRALVAILHASARGEADRYQADLTGSDNPTTAGRLDNALPWIYLCGTAGSGRTHLLLASCAAARENGRQALYLGLQRPSEHPPSALNGMENADLVALDDVDCIAGNRQWEEALFHFLNRARARGIILLISAATHAEEAGFTLPDLRSRLNWGQRQRLKPLSDDDLLHVLRIHAQAHGLPVNDKINRYLLTHSTRNTTQLLHLLNQIEQTAFANKRKPSLSLAAEIVNAQMQTQSSTEN